MRIEGSRLVVTCRKCGLSVVAVGWQEGQAASDKTALDRGSSAAPSGREMVGGRLELEEGDERPRGPTSPPFKEYSFDPEVGFENPPVVGPETQPRTEAKIEAKTQPKPRGQGVDEARPAARPFPAPETRRRIPPPAQQDTSPGASAPSPMRKVVIASSVIALASALLLFALSTRRTEKAPEPKAAPSTPTAASAAEPATKAAAQALLPATPLPAPTPEPRPKAPATARSAPQEPTSKIPAAAAVPAAMSETEALSSGLVNAEVFQDRAGKVMTHILFCRNLERARNPGASPGALDVSLIVSPSGAVSEVRLDRALARSPLGLCLRDHLGKLEFPSWAGRAVEIRRHVDPGAAETPKAP